MSDAHRFPDANEAAPRLLPMCLVDTGFLLVVFLLLSLKFTSFEEILESRLPRSG